MPAAWVAAAGTVYGALQSGKQGSKASGMAAKQLMRAGEQASNIYGDYGSTVKGSYSPYTTLGTGSSGLLESGLHDWNSPLLRSFGASDFTADPGYAFRKSEGERGIESSAAASGGTTDNSAAVEFAAATGSWGTISHFGIYDASSSGNLLIHGAFSASKTIATGDILRVAAGDLDITAA